MRYVQFQLLAALLVCVPASRSEQRPSVAKCCGVNEELDGNLERCQAARDGSANPRTTTELPEERAARGRDPQETLWLPEVLLAGSEHGWAVRYGKRPDCPPRLTLRLVEPAAERAQLLRNGSLLLRSPVARASGAGSMETVFAPEAFCADVVADARGKRRRVILVCPCERVQCVSKCCPLGYAKACEGLQCTCVPHTDRSWQPFHSDGQLSPADGDVAYEVLEDNEPPCPAGAQLWFDNPLYRPNHVTRHWWKYPSGHLFRENLDKCGEIVILNSTQLSYSTIGYCYLSLPFDGFFELGTALHVPAALLLALTIVVLTTARDDRVSAYGWVHNRAMQCHTASLLASNSILAAYLISQDDTTFCRTTPIAMYFSLVSASLWLNVICINMAIGFWAHNGVHINNRRNRHTMLLGYSLYAWGTSIAMTTFTAIMWFAHNIPKGFVRPTLMETRRCFWEDEEGAEKAATLAYFYGPVCSLLLCNGGLFCAVAARVRGLRRASSILGRGKVAGTATRDPDARFQLRRSALLYVKLLWLMGVAEMAVEISAWAAHRGGFYYLMAADVIDLLRAASVFALCVCKRRTLRALRDRLRRGRIAAPGGGGDEGGGTTRRTTELPKRTERRESLNTQTSECPL